MLKLLILILATTFFFSAINLAFLGHIRKHGTYTCRGLPSLQPQLEVGNHGWTVQGLHKAAILILWRKI